MTKLLDRAFSQAAKLPQEAQDALARLLLEEMNAEAEWEEAFASSQDELATMAKQALAEHKAGKTPGFQPCPV